MQLYCGLFLSFQLEDKKQHSEIPVSNVSITDLDQRKMSYSNREKMMKWFNGTEGSC